MKIQELDHYHSAVLKSVKNSGFSHIIIDCKPETVPQLLEDVSIKDFVSY